VNPTGPAPALPSPGVRADRYSEVQQRTIAAALDLFAEHGVGGTSLQMIADRVGVTKAAIYHQFKTKEAIVLAVAETTLVRLEDALAEAEAQPSREAGRVLLLERVIDLAIERRRWVNALQGDRVMIRLLGEHPPFVDLMNRVYALLLDEAADDASLMRTAIVSAAVGAAIVHPLVAHLDDETMRAELLRVTRRLFDLGPTSG
jgi:AcrR family transcriptional regulator